MRQVRALCIVAALVFAAPLVDGFLPAADASQPSATAVGIDASVLSMVHDADDALDRLGSMVDDAGAAPDWFEREIGFLPGARDVRASGAVVGYVVDADCEGALDELRASLGRRGWSCVDVGGVDGVTCVKDSGACTWMLVTCTQVGSSTSVVARCEVS